MSKTMSLFDFNISSEQGLLLLGNLYVASRALHVVAEKRIADLFEDNQPQSIEEIVKQHPMSPVTIQKILRVLCPFGIFKEHGDGTFSLEKIGQTLRSNHPSSMRDLLFCEDCRWNSFGQMTQSLQTGETGFSTLYGTDYFDYIAHHPHLQEGFDNHMKAVSAKEDPIIASHLPLKGKKKIVDIGSGKGGLMKAILNEHPDISGALFELPGVAKQEIERLSNQYKGRLEVFWGSFLHPLPFKCDGVILKRILHNWGDTDCVRILKNCRDALTNHLAEIYIVESLIKGKEDSPLLRIFDLLLLTVFGGIERSKEDYQSLLCQAGLTLKTMIPTPSGSSILVVKKADT